MTYDLVIKNGCVISGHADFTGDVAVAGERIAALGRDLKGRQEIDATGMLVIPGAIDGHVHMRTERKTYVYDETFATGSVAAAFGGTTTIIDQIQVEPGVRLNDALDARLREAQGQACVDFAFHMNIREEDDARLAEIGDVAARGIASFKWFMSTPGWEVSDTFLMRSMWETAAHGALNVVHAENSGVLQAMRRRSRDLGLRPLSRFTENAPAAAEAAAIHLAVAMTEISNGRTLIFHNTCEEGVAVIRAAKARGVRAYGEVCLAYLMHDEEVYRGNAVAALPFLVSPPIRDARHQAALWDGLARGDLDIVSTDHTANRMVPEAQAVARLQALGLKADLPPPSPADRRDADGNRLTPLPPPGGLETRLPLLYSRGVRTGRLDLHRWVELCCAAPARIFDLTSKGQLLPGFDADIVIFDPQVERTFSVDTLHSNTDYSVWEGWKTVGKVEKTFSRGRLIVDGDRFLGKADQGRYLHRTASPGADALPIASAVL